MPTPSSPRIRTIFSTTSCTVSSYPSTGGIIFKRVTGVELDSLNLARTQKTHCAETPVEEDSFALHMLQLGARWWPSREFYTRHCDVQYPYGHHYPPDLHVGYPSTGGVLVLRVFVGNSATRLETDAPEKAEEWAKLGLCGTMDERCSVLGDFGAEWFEDVAQCDEIPKTLSEGVVEGKRYEGLMRKMEDISYLDEWLMSL